MKTAIEQAKQMFDRLVNLKIDKAPLPLGQKRVYAVATLPNGMMVMSDGSRKMSYPQKKLNSLAKDSYEQMINKDKILDQQKDSTLGVAIPESQLGKPGQIGVDLVGFLGKFLKPQMQAAPEAGLTVLLPGQATDEDFQRVSALSSLPGTVPQQRDLFSASDFSKRFLQQGKNVQEELMKEFLAQINRGEAQSSQISKFNMPVIAGYDNRYSLPNAGNPASATIGTNVNQLTNQIR